ncbi:hypothetical protein TRFO_01886 [Tritrichomonas foetus]|uniref:RRM domain-containing protein n=1 Tax=Tritrichomonas foetus TaxID=1144522 RepID=A0A1J4JMQ8_9EUKA|nr:hypothetical protein TRFO_01886 [Tritrichomonas foetus]|eukprot:OHS98819.1 hypothetical protein TRFO_01886 [Tritrichomonas foetus]
MSECTVQIHPSFDKRKFMAEYFTRKGFNTFTDVQVFDSDCYVTFPNRAEAEEFANAFDGRRVNNQAIRAIIRYLPEDLRPSEAPPKRYPSVDERRIRSRTICVKGYPLSKLTDRNLYHDFWKSGYLKQIEISNGVGYLQFDTPDDAETAILKNDQMCISGSRITVEMIPDRALNVPNVLVPLVIADKDDRIIRDDRF